MYIHVCSVLKCGVLHLIDTKTFFTGLCVLFKCVNALFVSVQPTEGGSIIDVHVNKLYEAGQTSMDRDPVERSGMSLKQRWKGPLKCLPCTAVIVERWAGDSAHSPFCLPMQAAALTALRG